MFPVVSAPIFQIENIMFKRLSIILLIAIAHLAASRLIVWITMQLGMFATDDSPIVKAIGHTLVALTRVLYFPIVSLSLYTREWFPGTWIYVPMLANSLVWAVGVCLLYLLWRKYRKRKT
jgi:hypothetical protein